MFIASIKVLLAATIISFTAWLSQKKPELAGFIIALPIASLIALAFSYSESQNNQNTIIFAKSIITAVPVSYLFFVPFFFADKLANNFWLCYIIGIIFLLIGFFIHKFITAQF